MKKSLREHTLLLAGSCILAVILLVFVRIGTQGSFFLFPLEDGITKDAILNLFGTMTKSELCLYWLIATAFCFVLFTIIRKLPKTFWDQLYRYRYAVGILVIAFCVIFELSGSSVSWYSLVFPEMQGNTDTLFRTYNPQRSDEFVVNTIFAIAQEKNTGQAYSYFSDIVRGTTTDMFLVYGQPVWHYGVLFRPFQIGYLLFGSSRGLSFFWCARLVMLILVTFDFGMLLTEQKKKLSVCLAVMTAFAPIVQWWFAINGLVEQLIFGQLCVLTLNRFMQQQSGWRRVLTAVLFFWSGGCFILIFYPSWQIPFGYAFLALMIAVVLKNRKSFTWSWKKDLPAVLIVAAVWALLLGGILIKSWDTIQTTLNTAYPGKRTCTTKLTLRNLFAYIYNLFLPFIDTGANPEQAVFIDFFPLGLLLSLWYGIKEKKKDILLILMNLCAVILLLIYLLPVPELLLKITLLSRVQPTRALIAIGFLNLLILLRVFALKQGNWSVIERIVMAVLYPAAAILIAKNAYPEITTTRTMLAGMIIVFAGGILLLTFCKNEKVMNTILVSCIVLFAFCGGLVNPVQKGIDFLLDCPLAEEIASVVEEDSSGKWIVEGTDFWGGNLPLLGGAATINSTNVYPNLEQWAKLDPDGENEEIYNRYAHITMDLTDSEETSFTFVQADLFEVTLNAEDLQTLEVSYILSLNELEPYSNETVTIERIRTCDRWYIYQVTYQP